MVTTFEERAVIVDMERWSMLRCSKNYNEIYVRSLYMMCVIKLIWSEEEKFWYSKSLDERFGLTLESGSLDVLIERVRMAVPEMLELSGYLGEVELSFEIDRNYKIEVVAS